MRNLFVATIGSVFIASWLFGFSVSAASAPPILHRASPFGLPDADGDGIPDVWEAQIFHTNSEDVDTDHDRHDDLAEIRQGFNPNGAGAYILGDFDQDGLNDRLEILFGADPTKTDTDSDGFADGQEVAAGFSPISVSKKPLEKQLVITLSKQKLDQRLGGITLATYTISSGKRSTPTPVGDFRILEKKDRRWSNHAKLWMPWWMEIEASMGYGLHELPEWPGGKKEGANHLGTPVSGGCVRLGVGPAKLLYDWTPIGTAVHIQR